MKEEQEDIDIVKELTFKGKYEYIQKQSMWPEWSNQLVGVAHGWHAFELEEDFNLFMEKYRAKHKNDQKTDTYIRVDDTPQTRKIGF